ncbi:DUF3299 domain-containing protein [Motilimonas eburnea]|uniref:DUF3299 domain-containing protein n=1 Tax=Motilimonas eburnea TaxID=1737488 RepID=UPI001E32024C|nr:DUF3299 domain-containing protein [Motilimonas eburnea]MCE2570260.1 DUF3299 domain-containing protein [Motilimonas eburnea]
MKHVITAFLLSLFSMPLYAETPLTLDWSNLNSEAKPVTIKLPELTEDQKRLLQGVIILNDQDSEESRLQKQHIESQLAKQGLNASELIQLRQDYMQAMKENAETVTDAYNGKLVRMPGFIVPIEYNENLEATELLLVPVAGACIHMPPPAANQIVRIYYPSGFEVQNVQYPVWVEGKFNANVITEEVFLVDGGANVAMGYEMKATLIEDYYE